MNSFKPGFLQHFSFYGLGDIERLHGISANMVVLLRAKNKEKSNSKEGEKRSER